MPDISCNKVNLFYKKTHALQDVSFTIKENTICGLLGRNGAGKTSLMSLLASFRQASSGEVLFGGKAVYDNPSVMPQTIFIYSRSADSSTGMKVREYLKGCAQFRPQWSESYAQELLRNFDINERKSIDSLSLGQRASVYAISGLASRCPVTLYDEAYLGMDAAVRKYFIQEVLEDYMRVPRTILFSTHFIGEIENMIEDVLVMSEGKVLMHENTDILRGRGLAITGELATVDNFLTSLDSRTVEILASRQLGNQKEVVVYGKLPGEHQTKAASLGLSLAQPSLQDLFVHITETNVLENNSSKTPGNHSDSQRRFS